MRRRYIVYGLIILGISVLAYFMLQGAFVDFAGACNAFQLLAPCADKIETMTLLTYLLGAVGAIYAIYGAVAEPESKVEITAKAEGVKVICPACGMMNAQAAVFCSKCGAKMLKEKVKCPYCKSENAPNAAFCAICGAKLPEQKEEPGKAAKFTECHNCGAENSRDADICRKCGAKLR